MLGFPVIYHTATEHLTVTEKAPVGEKKTKLEGSIHHPSQVDFAGLCTGENEDGSFALTIFPPGRAPTHIENVKEGKKPGQFEYVDA